MVAVVTSQVAVVISGVAIVVSEIAVISEVVIDLIWKEVLPSLPSQRLDASHHKKA